MLTNFLIWLHRTIKPSDSDKFFDTATNIILLTANIIDVLVVLIMAMYVNKFLVVLYAVIMAMLIRVGKGEHYDTWGECCISGLLIYTLYAFTSLLVNNFVVDLVLGVALAVYMIDFSKIRPLK